MAHHQPPGNSFGGEARWERRDATIEFIEQGAEALMSQGVPQSGADGIHLVPRSCGSQCRPERCLCTLG